MKEKFINKKFQGKSLKVIAQGNEIIDEYLARGYKLTLRQLYYQFVARGLIDNKQSEYKRLGALLNDARLAGLMDWAAIEDRTRNLNTIASWGNPESIIDSAAASYQEDLWADQDMRFVAMIEKEALIGVITNVCEELRVPYMACRGYLSQSEAYEMGKRIGRWSHKGQRTIILHLGDHDPSGLDMTRDNDARLNMFASWHGCEVRRLALNMDQVEEFNPPPNPAKETDARFAEYAEQYGESSWELDALDPDFIAGLIRQEVENDRDPDKWEAAVTEEDANKERLDWVSNNWNSKIVPLIDNRDAD